MIPAELYVLNMFWGVLYCVEETVKLKIINFISAHTHTHIVRSLPFYMEFDMEAVSIVHGNCPVLLTNTFTLIKWNGFVFNTP